MQSPDYVEMSAIISCDIPTSQVSKNAILESRGDFSMSTHDLHLLYLPVCPKLAWSADAQFMAAVYQEAGLLPTDPGTLHAALSV